MGWLFLCCILPSSIFCNERHSKENNFCNKEFCCNKKCEKQSCAQDNLVHFLAISDMHISTDSIDPDGMYYKKNLVPQMINYIQAQNIQAVLIPGDMTHGGFVPDKAAGNNALFKRIWYDPLKSAMIAKGWTAQTIFYTIGNHDVDAKRWPRYTAISDEMSTLYTGTDFNNSLINWFEYPRCDNFCYTFDRGCVRFISLGLGPWKYSLDRRLSWYFGALKPWAGSLVWLKRLLAQTDKTKPLVFFFHFPLVDNYMSYDPAEVCPLALPPDDIEAFKNMTAGHNVRLIVVGHTHENRVSDFNGIAQINVSGMRFAHMAIDENTYEVIGDWVDKNGKIEHMNLQ